MKKAFLFTFLLIILLIIALMQSYLYASPALSITVTTDKKTYHLRETVNIYGNLTSDGTPLQNGLVAVEVLDPIDGAIAYRTLTTGEITTVNTPHYNS
ncbi:MAG: hypothetical protein QHH17_03285 [Candidatus Bathyarchaeota archaeon]|nr:hypothetical protein [Candidatus Bathyarchaeota archaeon]